MKVLITGGAGYIGSTVGSALLDRSITPIILDSLVTGHRDFVTDRPFYQGDIADGALIDEIFARHPDIVATVHCAALIVVPESVRQPLRYYTENVAKTIALVGHLTRNGCRRLLFSSSASIYQPATDGFVDEHSPIAPTSPYAKTKAMIEEILADTAATGAIGNISLRYFNPIGCDPKLRSGHRIRTPSHVMSSMIHARRSGVPFTVTGTDWPTRDGSGIRDYIHVWDLAQAHVHAILHFDDAVAAGNRGSQVINLGTGNGTTVRELVSAFSAVSGQPLPTVDAPARPGDAAGAYTRSDRSHTLLHWQPTLSIEDGIRDALAWRDHDREWYEAVAG